MPGEGMLKLCFDQYKTITSKQEKASANNVHLMSDPEGKS